MKRTALRLALTLVASAAVVAVSQPAQAVDLKDIGRELGIDLEDILGGRSGGKLDGFALAESILKSELPRRVGPAARYDVKLDRAGSDLAKGRFSRVSVLGIDVRTSDGLTIPKMDLSLQDVRLGLSSRSIDTVGKSDFTAGLGAEAVTQFVRKRGGAKLRDAKVAFEDGQIVVEATPELMGFGMPSELAGKPVLRGADGIDFKGSRLSLFGVKLPQLAVGALERKINPVVDLSGLKLPVRITKIAVEGSRLVADGAADFRSRR